MKTTKMEIWKCKIWNLCDMTWIEMKLKCQEIMETFTFRSQPFLPLSLSPGRNGRAWIHQDCNCLGPCNCSSCSYLGPSNWYHLNIAVPLVFHRSQRGDLWPSPVVASTHLLSNVPFLKKVHSTWLIVFIDCWRKVHFWSGKFFLPNFEDNI